MPYIEIKDLNFKYPKTERLLFNQFNWTMEKQNRRVLKGDNGIGKSTLTKLIMGLLTPTLGTVLIDGMNVEDMELYEVGRKIGYLFQNPELQLFNSTLKEELLFKDHVLGTIDENAKKKAEELIRMLRLNKSKNTSVFKLSRGEKQRLAIGTLLMNEPEFLILDEPTVGLDENAIDDLIFILREKIQFDIGILIISHHEDFIRQLGYEKSLLTEQRIYYEK